jgi:hypothetical protein
MALTAADLEAVRALLREELARRLNAGRTSSAEIRQGAASGWYHKPRSYAVRRDEAR